MTTKVSGEPEQRYEAEIELDPVGERGFSPAENANNGGKLKRFRGPDRDPDSTLHRHITHCTICNHPERDAIEECILHWHSPTAIADEFGLGDRRVVWRHARAFGLSQLRAAQARHALGFLIEQAQGVVPSADAIIRAIRALSCIDDQGRWHEPRKEVIITHRYEDATSQPREEQGGAMPARRGGQARGAPRNHRHRQSSRSLGGRSLSSDRQAAEVSGASAPEAKRPSLLRRLFTDADDRRKAQNGPPSFLGTRAEKSSG